MRRDGVIRLWFANGCTGRQKMIELPPNVRAHHIEAVYELCVILAKRPSERLFCGEGRPFQNGRPGKWVQTGAKPHLPAFRDWLIENEWAAWRNGHKRGGGR